MQTFKGIVNTQGYTGKMVEFVGEEEETKVKEMNWVNTNVLLKEGYEGVKTGYTGDAGGCLVSVKEIRFKNQSNKYLIIVLASKDQASRFTDTQIIAKNHFKYL
jgi:D-alanyl-D-alanine carboxypeptidase